MKVFTIKDKISGIESEFDENSAPDWLTKKSAVKGSTMDNSWFWEGIVLTLAIGVPIETDFHIITRVK